MDNEAKDILSRSLVHQIERLRAENERLRAELAAERERTKAIEEELDLREQEDCNEENYLQSQVDKLTAKRDALRAHLEAEQGVIAQYRAAMGELRAERDAAKRAWECAIEERNEHHAAELNALERAEKAENLLSAHMETCVTEQICIDAIVRQRNEAETERDALRAEAVSVAKMAEQISAQNGELVCENEALRSLLREAREYTGYAAFYGDRIEADHAVDLCARIDAALNKGGGGDDGR